MLAGDIDISYSQGLVPFINAVKSKAPLKLVDIAMGHEEVWPDYAAWTLLAGALRAMRSIEAVH